jgi:hypothetical protein
MESYWSSKKNSIVNWINSGVDFDPGLVPCIKSECDEWKDGECIYIHKVGDRVRINFTSINCETLFAQNNSIMHPTRFICNQLIAGEVRSVNWEWH